MSERMPEIKERAPASLSLVLGNDVRFNLAASADCEAQRIGIERQELIDMFLQPVKQCCIEYQSVFDDLCQTGRELSAGAATGGAEPALFDAGGTGFSGVCFTSSPIRLATSLPVR